MIDKTDFERVCSGPCAGSHCLEHGRELRDARDLIVQLQRELERAREVIAHQRASVRRAFRLNGERGGS